MFLFSSILTSTGAQMNSSLTSITASFPRAEDDHSLPSNAEVKNVWSYNPLPHTFSCYGAQQLRAGITLISLTQDASNQTKHIHVIYIHTAMFCQIWGSHGGCRGSTSPRKWSCVNGQVVPNTSKDPTAFQILGILCPLTQKHIPEDHVLLVRSRTLFFINRLFQMGKVDYRLQF